jgi:hypothetical protein
MKKESFSNLEHFCDCLDIKQSDVVKVIMPDWWSNPDKNIVGYTDDKETYCCELRPAVFVWVPDYDYDGYFYKKDLQVIT